MTEFYFRSYDRVIGKACNVIELERELCRLTWVDPNAVTYHLRQGHVASWLETIGEKELAEEVSKAGDIIEACRKIAKHNERSMVLHEMQVGRMH
jgi:hypothetical protein